MQIRAPVKLKMPIEAQEIVGKPWKLEPRLIDRGQHALK
jgi:hypothetical protein